MPAHFLSENRHMNKNSLSHKISKTLRGTVFGFTKHNLFFGWFFLNFVKTYKLEGCRFPLSKNLFTPGYYARFLFDTYEKHEIKCVKRYVKPDDTVLELGACLGIVSCVTNKQLETKENHVVVEANPTLISEIEKNREVNQCGFHLENKLISDQKENTFHVYNLAVSGSLVEKKHNPRLKLVEKVNVEGVGISDLEKQYGLNFNVLVMDIEGGEYQFLKNNYDFIDRLRLLIIEFHPHLNDPEDKFDYHGKFEEMGFKMVESSEHTYVYLR